MISVSASEFVKNFGFYRQEVQLREGDQMLVIAYAYSSCDSGDAVPVRFEVAPDTIALHLIAVA